MVDLSNQTDRSIILRFATFIYPIYLSCGRVLSILVGVLVIVLNFQTDKTVMFAGSMCSKMQ
jgi:hypothetical protein